MKKELVKKVALYGGAFDPPHKGHQAIISNLSGLKLVDEVWLLPCGDRNDKKLLLNKDQRFALLNRLVVDAGHLSNVKLSNQQIQLSKKEQRMIPTIHLLDHLQKKYEGHEFYFVVGSDILCTINTWEEHKRLLKQKNFIVYPRVGYQIKGRFNEQQTGIDGKCKVCEHLPEKSYYSSFIAPQISSTFVKNTLLDEKLSKEQKRDKVDDFLHPFTIQILQKKSFIR